MNLFTKHPKEVGETYLQHMCVALGFSFVFLLLTLSAFVHAFVPFIFINTASNKVFSLHKKINKRK
jgi:hypothetical protein